VDVPGLESGAAGVAAGAYHTCAVTVQGAVTCWGSNTEGQIGDDRGCGLVCVTPVDVVGLSSGVAVLAAGGYHTCALTTAGGVLCWGYNFTGQVGDGTNNNIRRAPVHVSGLESGITFIAANGTFHGHTCALTASGALTCWGDNAAGQLGDGTTTDGLVPVDVAGLSSGVVGVAPGNKHTCAIVAPATLTCWGDNAYGQLGDGTTIARLTATDGGGQKARAGDANCDSAVNSIDAALILQLVAGLIRSLPCPANGDVNHDDTVNAIDSALVLQCTAGLLDCAAV
jgi:alpha-tubulin suppressor-like RCC1 family protein